MIMESLKKIIGDRDLCLTGRKYPLALRALPLSRGRNSMTSDFSLL